MAGIEDVDLDGVMFSIWWCIMPSYTTICLGETASPW